MTEVGKMSGRERWTLNSFVLEVCQYAAALAREGFSCYLQSVFECAHPSCLSARADNFLRMLRHCGQRLDRHRRSKGYKLMIKMVIRDGVSPRDDFSPRLFKSHTQNSASAILFLRKTRIKAVH
jgi:hypothetical protein